MLTNDIISQNYTGVEPPVDSAFFNVEYHDTKTRTLYYQRRMPFGTDWIVKQTNYTTPSFQVYLNSSDQQKGYLADKIDNRTLKVDNLTQKLYSAIAAGDQWVINEVPGGLQNDSNTIFTTAFKFQAGKLIVIWRAGIQDPSQYTENATLDGFVTAFAPDKLLYVCYPKAIVIP